MYFGMGWQLPARPADRVSVFEIRISQEEDNALSESCFLCMYLIFIPFFKKNTTVHFSQTPQPALIQKQLTSFLDGLEDTCYYNGSGRSIANYYFRSQVDKFRSFTFDIFIFIVRHKKKGSTKKWKLTVACALRVRISRSQALRVTFPRPPTEWMEPDVLLLRDFLPLPVKISDSNSGEKLYPHVRSVCSVKAFNGWNWKEEKCFFLFFVCRPKKFRDDRRGRAPGTRRLVPIGLQ